MPSGDLKNLIYHMALPIWGAKSPLQPKNALEKLLQRRHVIGGALQCFRKGELTELTLVGLARENTPLTGDRLLRTASLAKTVTALLVFRLQTLGLLDTEEDISALWGSLIRNPLYPDTPITLAMLMSHTSSLADGPAYFRTLHGEDATLSSLLAAPGSYLSHKPGKSFRYSNFGAGIIGSLLEKRFQQGIGSLLGQYLFEPLNLQGGCDLAALSPHELCDCLRVLPPSKAFDAEARIRSARSMAGADPERHYLPCAGGFFLTAPSLARLALLAYNGGGGFLNEESLSRLHTPLISWGESKYTLEHCMGLFRIDDSRIAPTPIWGHQGIAYGSVNGLFFDGEGTGFALLTTGASEERYGHLTRLNLDLVRWMWE